jgi:hypothetical protein
LEDACLNHLLEDEVFVIVAKLQNVGHKKVIEGELPLIESFSKLSVVIYLFLCDVCVEDLPIDPVAESRRYSSLCVLDKEGLVVLSQEPFTNEDPLINKALFLVYTYLAIGHIKLVEFLSELVKGAGLQLKLDLSPGEHEVPGKVNRVDLKDSVHQGVGIENERKLSTEKGTILVFLGFLLWNLHRLQLGI